MNTCSRHCIPLELDKKVVTGSQVCDLCKFASNKISRFNRGSRRRVNVSSSDVDLKREGNVLQLTKDNSRGLDLIHTQNALVYLYNYYLLDRLTLLDAVQDALSDIRLLLSRVVVRRGDVSSSDVEATRRHPSRFRLRVAGRWTESRQSAVLHAAQLPAATRNATR